MEFFSVNGAEYNVGQENLYKDPCDDWLDLINKRLTSPNYPEPYDPLTNCKWNLTEKHGYYISLDIERIEVSLLMMSPSLMYLMNFGKFFISQFCLFQINETSKAWAPIP